MKRMGVRGVGLAIITAMLGCLSPSRDPQMTERQAESAVAATDTGETAAAPSQGDDAPPSSGDVPSSPCGDGVCDDDISATSSEVLSLLASNPEQFAAVMATTFPGYDHDAAERLRQQFLTTELVNATVTSAMADAAQHGRRLREESQTSRELEAVGYFIAPSLLNDQQAPPDAPFLSSRRGLVFGAAVLDEVQGLASAQNALIANLKTSRSGDHYLLVAGQWGFGWITDAYKWVKRQLSDGWKWTRSHVRNLRWGCIAASAGVVGACSACVATAIAAPETAGGSLALAQHACGVGCVSAVIAAAQSCH